LGKGTNNFSMKYDSCSESTNYMKSDIMEIILYIRELW